MSGPAERLHLQIVPPPLLENAKAEQALLGALLSRVELAGHLPERFHGKHFADPWHRELYDACCLAASQGTHGPVAALVVNMLAITELEKREYLGTLLTASPSLMPKTVAAYADAVTDFYKRRMGYDLARKLSEACTSNLHNPVDNALALHIADAAELAHQVVEALDGKLHEGIDQALAMSEATMRNGGAIGISTGLRSVDARLGGLEPGTVTVLGGRPGMGKSALGWQWAIDAALRQGKKVAGFSLEMTRAQLGRRAVAAATGIPADVIRRGQIRDGQMARLVEARNKLYDADLRIVETGGLTAREIQLRASSLARKMGGRLDLVIVDHLHIVRAEKDDVKAGATWAVGQISRALKALAKDTGAAVLALAQLSRATESRDDKRPTMADLRQAGDIEQDADAICFLYRGEYYLSPNPPEKGAAESPEKHREKVTHWEENRARLRGLAELICSKVRDGEPGSVALNFHGPTTSFSEQAHG